MTRSQDEVVEEWERLKGRLDGRLITLMDQAWLSGAQHALSWVGEADVGPPSEFRAITPLDRSPAPS